MRKLACFALLLTSAFPNEETTATKINAGIARFEKYTDDMNSSLLNSSLQRMDLTLNSKTGY